MTSASRNRFRRSGKALAIALPVVCIAALSVTVFGPARSQAEGGTEPSIEEVAGRSMLVGLELHHLGITPDALAAAGVSADETRAMIRALSLDTGSGVGAFAAARKEAVRAEASYQSRAARVRSGRATEEEAAECAELREMAAHRMGVCGGAEENVFEIVRAAIGDDRFRVLSTVRANIAEGVELPYAATELTALDRLRLRDAIDAREQAQRSGPPVENSSGGFLAELDSRPEVASASLRLEQAGFVQSAFESALHALDGQ